jgi:acyl-coenzyme A thioesterase PaaI-like protein
MTQEATDATDASDDAVSAAFAKVAAGPHVREDRALADAVRELIRLCRSSAVDDAARDDALAHLRSAADLLAAEQYRGPYWVTGHSALESFAPTLDLQALCPFSPAMGPANPLAPDIEISVDDDNTVHGLVTLGEAYNGPPFDHAHGGVVALLYDDLVGMATMLGAGGGMTANLSIDYRRPTPLFKPLEITAWFDHTEGRKLYSQGTMHCEGELLSEAHGLFIRPASCPVGTPPP